MSKLEQEGQVWKELETERERTSLLETQVEEWRLVAEGDKETIAEVKQERDELI